MAKQTFTTGQVLTAAQMTSLQETAMGGGPATAKTANYVLVAADAGTTVAMNAATATTITVNTGLFAAGDTVFIQNLGAGNCTITAGTATVATAGSLILPQNDAGILYFTSASAAIFYDYIQVGAASPLTTKGDLYTFSTSDTRLGVGSNNTVLTADNAEATGLKWAASGGMTLLSTTTLTGTSVTVSSINQTYNYLHILITGIDFSIADFMIIRPNAATSSLNNAMISTASATATTRTSAWDTSQQTNVKSTSNEGSLVMNIYNYNSTSSFKTANWNSAFFVDSPSANVAFFGYGTYANTDAITSIQFRTDGAGSFDAGTVKIYGVK